jgi:hypothetical protein
MKGRATYLNFLNLLGERSVLQNEMKSVGSLEIGPLRETNLK